MCPSVDVLLLINFLGARSRGEIETTFRRFNMENIQHLALPISSLIMDTGRICLPNTIYRLSAAFSGIKTIINRASAYETASAEYQHSRAWTNFAKRLTGCDISDNGHSRDHLPQHFVKFVSPKDDSLPWDWEQHRQKPRHDCHMTRPSTYAFDDFMDSLTYDSDAPANPAWCLGGEVYDYYEKLSLKEGDEIFKRLATLHSEEDAVGVRRLYDEFCERFFGIID